jgi:hypothetical protein
VTIAAIAHRGEVAGQVAPLLVGVAVARLLEVKVGVLADAAGDRRRAHRDTTRRLERQQLASLITDHHRATASSLAVASASMRQRGCGAVRQLLAPA